jgi:integrase
MKMRLTQAIVDKLAFTPGETATGKPVKENSIFDAEQRGLVIRIFGSGEKTYYVKCPTGRMKIGSCAAIKLTAARSAAAVTLGKAAAGADPVRERKEAKLQAEQTAAHDKQTLRALVETFEALKHAQLRSSTLSEMRRAIHSAFAGHLDTPAARIDRATAVNVLDQVVKKGAPVMAHRTSAYLSTIYTWAVGRGALKENPFAKMPYSVRSERDRVLEDWELRAIWKAAESMGVYGAIVRMLMVTGARREEVAEAPWSELSPDLSVWTIPGERTKNKQTHILPLPALVREILASQTKISGNPHVFPSIRQSGSFANFTPTKVLIDKASGVAGWRLHDLRRTVATNLQKLGVRLEVTEALLNHVSGSRGGIVGIYQRHDFAPEKVTAMEAWDRRLREILAGSAATDNVVKWRKEL